MSCNSLVFIGQEESRFIIFHFKHFIIMGLQLFDGLNAPLRISDFNKFAQTWFSDSGKLNILFQGKNC